MSTITVQASAKASPPRAAGVLAALFTGLLGWFERVGSARAERMLQADREHEAAAVREYARRFASHDPRFAAELLAAADRHERTE